MISSTNNFFLTLIIVFLGSFMVGGCLKTSGSNGYIINKQAFKNIKENSHSKKDVLKIAGSPSSKSTFGQEKWYYVRTENDRIAFGSPKITTQDIITVTFNGDIVEEVNYSDITERKEIKISKESTPTKGNKVGFAEQILGNLGRYNNNIPVD